MYSFYFNFKNNNIEAVISNLTTRDALAESFYNMFSLILLLLGCLSPNFLYFGSLTDSIQHIWV